MPVTVYSLLRDERKQAWFPSSDATDTSATILWIIYEKIEKCVHRRKNQRLFYFIDWFNYLIDKSYHVAQICNVWSIQYCISITPAYLSPHFHQLAVCIVYWLSIQFNWYINFTDGEFGAMMTVDISNDGPVTLIVDSRNPKGGDEVS